MDDPLAAMIRAEQVNNETRPVRIAGAEVSRPASEGTRTAHSLLRHLRARGLDCVPEPLGASGGSRPSGSLPGTMAARGGTTSTVIRALPRRPGC